MFFKDSVHTLIIRVFGYLFALAIQVIIARFLGAEAKGELQIALFILTLVSLLVGLGFERAIIFFLGKEKYGLREIWRNTIAFLTISCGLSLVIWLPLVYVAQPLLGEIRFGLLIIIFLIMPFERLFSMQLGVFNGRGEIRLGNWFSFFNSLGYALLVAVMVILVFPASESVLYANFLGFFGAGIAVLIYFRRKLGIGLGIAFNVNLIGEFLTFALKGQIGNITKMIASRFDLLVMNYYLGLASAGIYSVALNFADLLMFVPFVLAYVVFPHASRRDQEQGWLLVHRTARISFMLSLLSGLIIAAAAPVAIPILFSSDFIGAVKPLWILLSGVVFYSTFTIIASGVSGMGYPLVFSICNIVTVAVSIILNLALVPKYQADGAAFASAVAFFLAFMTLMLIMKIYFRQKVTELLLVKREDIAIIRENIRQILKIGEKP